MRAIHDLFRHQLPSRAAGIAAYLVELLVVSSIYYLIAKAGLALASINPSATPIWPATGFALALLILRGVGLWPAIFLGALIVNATTAGSLYTSCAIATGNMLEAAVGCQLVNAFSGGRNTFSTPAGVTKFALFSLPATALSASIGVGSLALAGYAEWSKFPAIWMTWWLGDLAGALVVTPVLVLWYDSDFKSMKLNDLTGSLFVFACAALVGLLAFSPLIEQTSNRGPLAFLAVLPLMWAALSRNQRDTATVATILSCFAVWGTMLQGGPFAQTTLNDSFLLLLAFTISTVVPSLALSADISMRKRIETSTRFLHDLSDRLRRLTDPEAIMSAVATAMGQQLGVSRAGYSEMDDEGYATARAQWHADHLTDVTGRFPLMAFGPMVIDELMRGETNVNEDTEVDPRTSAFIGAYRAIDIRAAITVPLVKEGRLRAALHVFVDRPRRWIPAEVTLCQDVAERTWASVERARAETGMAKEMAERKRHEDMLGRTVGELSETTARLKEQARVLDLANVLVHNMNDEITLWNEGARRLYGWSKEEALGKKAHELLRTEFALPLDDIRRVLLDNGSWDGELVQHTKDGQRVVSQSHWELHRSETGSPIAILETNTDITERKRNEEHIGLVMRELSHRSKNLLAVVQSIARQVALGATDFATFERAFADRLQALANIHDLLVSRGWRGADLSDVVRIQLGPFGGAEQRLRFEGPKLFLTPKAAEQIGLALHELATNAAKHGAFSVGDGTVDLRWEIEAAGTVRIDWQENGVAAVEPPHKGFGYMVLTKVVPLSLQGKASLQFQSSGVSWTLWVPKRSALQGAASGRTSASASPNLSQ